MSLPALFGLLGGLLVLAFAANRLFQWTRVPDVVVLMATGMVIGPLLHWVRGEQFQDVTHAFGTLALILILFEGGLELDIRDTLRHFPGGVLFGLVSYGATTALIGFLIQYTLYLPRSSAMLVGAVLGCTSATIVLPLLEQWNVPPPVKVILMVESALGDVLGVLSVQFLLEYQRSSGASVERLVGNVAYEVGISLAAAVGVGVLWRRLLPKLSERRFWQVLTFSMVLLLYAGTEAAHANGLLAVLGFGLALANLPGSQPELRETMWGASWQRPSHHRQIHDFHAELAFLVRTFFFVLIGVVVRLRGLERVWPAVLGVLGAIFLARWGAMKVSCWSWSGVSKDEREMVLWALPRGLITVVLALEILGARGSEVAFLPALAFATILLTNIVVVGGSLRLRRGAAGTSEGGGAGAPVATEGR